MDSLIDGFVLTPSDTVDVINDVANYERKNSVYIHNITTGATVRVMPAAKKLPVGLTLSGTSGTANITINGTAYLATFNSDLATTASDFVTAHATALQARNIQVIQPTGSAVLIFKNVMSNAVSIANASGDLTGTALAKTPITVFVAQGEIFPVPVSRIYASTPTPPAGLVGLYSNVTK